MEGNSTFVTLLVVVGLGGFALWWYLNHSTAQPLVQTVPAGPCSSTGEQIAGGAFAAVGKYYTQGKVNVSPTQACIGITAAAKSTASGTAGFLADHSTLKSTVLFLPNTFAAPKNAIAHPVDTGKGIYNAAKSALSLGGIL